MGSRNRAAKAGINGEKLSEKEEGGGEVDSTADKTLHGRCTRLRRTIIWTSVVRVTAGAVARSGTTGTKAEAHATATKHKTLLSITV